jgi:hypothetical protein
LDTRLLLALAAAFPWLVLTVVSVWDWADTRELKSTAWLFGEGFSLALFAVAVWAGGTLLRVVFGHLPRARVRRSGQTARGLLSLLAALLVLAASSAFALRVYGP